MPFQQIVTMEHNLSKKVNKGVTIWVWVKAQSKNIQMGRGL